MINNLFLDLSLLFTKNQTTKKFIRHNYKNFKNKTNNRSKNIVLIEFSGWSFHHIINSYLSNFWSKKYSAKIHAYPGYVLNRYTLNFLGKIKFMASNLFPIKNFLIYKSFGVSKFFYPQLSNVEKDKAFKIYQQKIKVIKSRKSILNLKIDNVLIGDLIYDSYLKFYRIPTLNINDENFKNFLLESIKSFIFWNNYLNNNKIKAIILTHAVYSGAMLMRIALHKYKDIKVCSAGALGVYNFSKNKINPWLDFKSLRKEFNSLKPSIKSIALKNSKIRIVNRLNGLNISDLNTPKKNTHSAFKNTIIKKTRKTKILIAAHCFLDSPHIFGNFLFPDFMQWFNFLGKISKNTDYVWYIKAHPNFNPITYGLLKKFTDTNKKFILLPLNYSHKQILKEKIDFVLTVYGTVGWEYAFKGIPVINASKNNPHYSYNFNINPQSVGEYKRILLNLSTTKIKIDKKEIQEFYFMAYVYHVVDWLFMNQKLMRKTLNNYSKSFDSSTYKTWMTNFSQDRHHKVFNNLENFFVSKKFKILQNHCNYSLIKDIIKKMNYIPRS